MDKSLAAYLKMEEADAQLLAGFDQAAATGSREAYYAAQAAADFWREAFFATPPTTRAGALAALDWAGAAVEEVCPGLLDAYNRARRAIESAGRRAPKGGKGVRECVTNALRESSKVKVTHSASAPLDVLRQVLAALESDHFAPPAICVRRALRVLSRPHAL